MKKFILFFALFFCLISPFSAKAQTIDQINNFHSLITINKDTSINIKETIEYQTNLSKHGIFRYIPHRYNQKGLSYTALIRNIKVSDTDGQNIPFTTTRDSKFTTLKIGDPDRTFTGEKTYVISYNVENALKRFDTYDELYWDITGEGWQIPVLMSQAVVNSAYADIKDSLCFSGAVGGNDQLCTHSFDSKTAVFNYPNPINYGSNFTVLVALDQNSQIAFPTQTQILLKKLRDNWFAAIAILPAALFFFIWNSKGRDWMFISPNIYKMDKNAPKKKKPLFYQHRSPFHYEPFKDITPGEAGLLIDEKVDNQDVIAEIIDLARQKYLKLESIEKKGIFSKTDYLFTKLKEPGQQLSPQQKYLHEKIFSGSKEEVKLTSLKGTFYTHMEKAKSMIADHLKAKEIFANNPRNARAGNIALAIISNGLVFFLAIGFAASYLTSLPLFVSLLSAVISLIFAYQMPAKTAIGTNYYLQTKGLKTMINAGKWRQEIAEKKLFIEEVLPFAIALGVVKKLASDMDKLNLKAPSYLDANMASLSSFSAANFINSFSKAANSNLSYNPNSSSYSGGSGFSGGGSSGGGGGGGGGGSW